MCGIFGIVLKENSNFRPALFKSTVDYSFKLAESRGKESAGLALLSGNRIKVLKEPFSASRLIQTREYKKLFTEEFNNPNLIKNNRFTHPILVIGHTRLVTQGPLEINQNNQPIIKSGIVGIHNGIVVNDKELWKQFPSLERKYTVDTELILSLIRMFLKEKKSLTEAVQNTFSLIKGSASLSVLFNDINCLLLATNTGSLYICISKNGNICIFASELYKLERLIKKLHLEKLLGNYQIFQVRPGFGCLINNTDLGIEKFSLDRKVFSKIETISSVNLNIVDRSPYNQKEQKVLGQKQADGSEIKKSAIFSSFYYSLSPSINSLKRCRKCILPETMPFIKFDENGVCNYCRNYKKLKLKDKALLEKLLLKYRSKSDKPDCIACFSGGRDSSYGLHYLKTILKMNPIAYSYDWGMITDLGRRNQARMCGKLGIEHILVSADIRKKRENIRKNIQAWLKKPELGMIPLFMAGDKQYFYYANKIMKQTGVKLIVMCENILERTHFKHGFCGIKHSFTDRPPYFLSIGNKLKLAGYYLKQFLLNPSYLNSSIWNTLTGYISYYLITYNYLYLYQFINWDEKEIFSTLKKEYDWEVATDTKSTWRIGDGTAAFYNYIYYTIAGFTENDTFRSNQIREGMISREEALKLIEEENKPRYESIKWYCETIGIDFKNTLKKINSIPKLYQI